jgi:hypothetical protein
MNKILLLLYGVLGVAALFIGYKIFKGGKEQLAAFTADPLDYTLNSAPALAVGDTLSNPVSRWFGSLGKSDAEKEVDKMLGPVSNVKPSGGMTPQSFPDQQPAGNTNRNPIAGSPKNVVGRVTEPSANIGSAPRATNSTTYSGDENPTPPVTNFFGALGAKIGGFFVSDEEREVDALYGRKQVNGGAKVYTNSGSLIH